MRTSPLVPAEPNGPLVVEDSAERAEVISLFERHGVLLFRGLDIEPSNLVAFTNQFAEQYAPDAIWRQPRFGEHAIHTVNVGSFAIALHSEASFGAAWPEIIFFYCSVPPQRGGATTLCDGVTLFERLSRPTQRLFTARPLRYDVALQGRKTVVGGDVEWPVVTPGVSGVWDRTNGVYRLTVFRDAVHEVRQRSRVYSFCNYLLVGTGHYEIQNITFADGSPIPDDALAEVRAVAEPATIEIAWQPRDLLMIDNRRYMHGRRAFEADDVRDISIVQVLRASFAFGASTRTALG
jgi:alpha-ketoglutarate-dependent taurine dioxygenase